MNSLYDSLPVVHGTGEILQDSKTNWKNSKLRNEAVAKSFQDETSKTYLGRFVRMNDCGSLLKFAVAPSQEKRLISANFCRDRMCPSCQKRRSLVIFHQVKNICEAINREHPTYKYLLLTLTVPNVKADKLSDEIKHINASWNKLTKRSFFKKSIKGWFRAVEVTYNLDRDDYHPHLHILLCVPSNYFAKNYIKRDQWLQYWQESTKYPHITQVDVRAVKPNPKRPDSTAISSAAAEVGKYATKPGDYVARLPDGNYFAMRNVVRELAEGIARKRLIAFGGLMKEFNQLLQQQDAESDSVDLINIGDDTSAIEAVMVQVYRWNVGFSNYVN